MQIEHEKHGGREVLRLIGRLDGNGAPTLERAFDTCFAEGARHLVLDLSTLVYISSIGLSTILVGARRLDIEDADDANVPAVDGADNGSLILVGLTPDVRDVFEMTGFISLFQVVDSLADLHLL